ncbi:hypothetical protein PMI07_006667 [Rhizobium sp. CF080]|nr:hypothetical protein PMI07_006667 [Rhizobium sp. CF080]
MRRIKILAFGPVGYVTPTMVTSWDRAGIDLVGPLGSNEAFHAVDRNVADGAVIDLGYGTDVLVALTDILDELSIPSVFATTSQVEPGYRGFELSSRPEAMNAILRALLDPEDTAKH